MSGADYSKIITNKKIMIARCSFGDTTTTTTTTAAAVSDASINNTDRMDAFD